MTRGEAEPCPVCGDMATSSCKKCKAIKYCSKECQETDFAAHKHLCSFAIERPTDAHRRVLFFHHEGKKPEFLWKQISLVSTKDVRPDEDGEQHNKNEDEHEKNEEQPEKSEKQLEESAQQPGKYAEQPEMAQQFGDVNPVFEVIDTNPITNVPLGHRIHLCMDDDDIEKYSSNNQAMTAVTGTHHPGLKRFSGPFLAYACEVDEDAEVEFKIRDMTMADYSHVVAYLIDYGNVSDSNLERAKTKVECVKVMCDGDCKGGRFQAVKVPRFHPNIADGKRLQQPSAVSVAIGMPLIFTKLVSFTPKEIDHCNEIVSTMLISTDPEEKHDESQTVQGFGWPPGYWDADVGNVLAYNATLENLPLDTLEAFALFCKRVAYQFRSVDENDADAKSAKKEEILRPEAWEGFLREWEADKVKLINEVNEETDGEVEDLIARFRGVKLMGGTAVKAE